MSNGWMVSISDLDHWKYRFATKFEEDLIRNTPSGNKSLNATKVLISQLYDKKVISIKLIYGGFNNLKKICVINGHVKFVTCFLHVALKTDSKTVIL